MNKAIRVVASLFGVFAGFGGIEHGAFEILQGNVIPEGIMISSIGPPCEVDQVWNACEPALTVISNGYHSGCSRHWHNDLVGCICPAEIWWPGLDYPFYNAAPVWWRYLPSTDRNHWRCGWDQDKCAINLVARTSLWKTITFPSDVVALVACSLLYLAFWTMDRWVFLPRVHAAERFAQSALHYCASGIDRLYCVCERYP